MAGKSNDIFEFQNKLNEEGIHSKLLHIDIAAHSYLVEPLLKNFREFLDDFSFKIPKIPYVSNVTGCLIEQGDALYSEYFIQHLRHSRSI